MGALVFRPRGQTWRSIAVPLDLSLRLWRSEFFQGLYLAVEWPGADQQARRVPHAQRRRWQRAPRDLQADPGKSRLHRDRSGRIRGRHHRLCGADHEIQGGELRDLHHRTNSAGLRRVLASSRAAGLHAYGQDRANSQDWLIPFSDRIARLARAKARDGRVLASELSLQVVADRSYLAATRRQKQNG